MKGYRNHASLEMNLLLVFQSLALQQLHTARDYTQLISAAAQLHAAEFSGMPAPLARAGDVNSRWLLRLTAGPLGM